MHNMYPEDTVNTETTKSRVSGGSQLPFPRNASTRYLVKLKETYSSCTYLGMLPLMKSRGVASVWKYVANGEAIEQMI